MAINTVDCPVDFIQVNENRVRLTALWVLLLVLLSIFSNNITVLVFIFLSIDFFLRAFSFGKFSPLNILSGFVVKQLKIASKPIDQAPKRFAAGIGFVLSLLLVLLLITDFHKSAFVIEIIFAVFAFLESFLGFCAGCHIYSLLIRLKVIRKTK